MKNNIPVAEANGDSRDWLFICVPANISAIPLDPEKYSWQTNALRNVGIGIIPNKLQTHEGRDWVLDFSVL